MNDHTLNRMNGALSRLRKSSPAPAEKVLEMRERHAPLYSLTEEEFGKVLRTALRRNVEAGWCRLKPEWEEEP